MGIIFWFRSIWTVLCNHKSLNCTTIFYRQSNQILVCEPNVEQQGFYQSSDGVNSYLWRVVIFIFGLFLFVVDGAIEKIKII